MQECIVGVYCGKDRGRKVFQQEWGKVEDKEVRSVETPQKMRVSL